MAYASLSKGGKLSIKPKKKYPYKGITDKKYLKDRDTLFAENGNGWWWYQGTYLGRQHDRKMDAKENSKAEKKK